MSNSLDKVILQTKALLQSLEQLAKERAAQEAIAAAGGLPHRLFEKESSHK